MQPTAQSFGMANLVPMVLIFVVFYFLLIRPQKQKEKEHKKMLESLDKNDEIITSGGIHGTIVNVKETTFMVRIDENVRMEIDKAAVITVVKKQDK